MKIETILFDLDNTLVRCMVYFEFTRKNIFKVYSKLSGFSIEEIEEIFNEYESERVKKPDGFSKSAFIDSVNKARVNIYSRIESEDRKAAFMESDDAIRLINFACEVYEAPYTMYEDTVNALNDLKALGYSMYVVTKGDFYGQSKKVSQLPEVFDGLFVLPHKSKYTWNGVVEATQINRNTTLVVGDSIKDDILPSIQNRLNAIQINRLNTNWVGDPKMATPEGVKVISNLRELVDILS